MVCSICDEAPIEILETLLQALIRYTMVWDMPFTGHNTDSFLVCSAFMAGCTLLKFSLPPSGTRDGSHSHENTAQISMSVETNHTQVDEYTSEHIQLLRTEIWMVSVCRQAEQDKKCARHFSSQPRYQVRKGL